MFPVSSVHKSSAWKEGYRKIHQACHETAQYLADEIDDMGPFEIIYDGRGGMPGLCWKLKDGAQVDFSLYDFADRLRTRG